MAIVTRSAGTISRGPNFSASPRHVSDPIRPLAETQLRKNRVTVVAQFARRNQKWGIGTIFRESTQDDENAAIYPPKEAHSRPSPRAGVVAAPVRDLAPRPISKLSCP